MELTKQISAILERTIQGTRSLWKARRLNLVAETTYVSRNLTSRGGSRLSSPGTSQVREFLFDEQQSIPSQGVGGLLKTGVLALCPITEIIGLQFVHLFFQIHEAFGNVGRVHVQIIRLMALRRSRMPI